MPSIDTTDSETDRGQAYTLEGFIGAMVVLMAVLFALQSVVIMPTTGGLADRTVQAQIQQEVQDALIVSNQGGNLSETIRRWNEATVGSKARISHRHPIRKTPWRIERTPLTGSRTNPTSDIF